MHGIARTLATEGLHDSAFLRRYCVGYEIFSPILLGRSDGQPKDADSASAIRGRQPMRHWAGAACRRPAHAASPARNHRSAPSTREQPVWMVRSAGGLLGQIGSPAANPLMRWDRASNTGKPPLAVPLPTLPIERNSDCRFHSSGAGRRHAAPSGRAVRLRRPAAAPTPTSSWSIGRAADPFHHHQDLNRLRDAFAPT